MKEAKMKEVHINLNGKINTQLELRGKNAVKCRTWAV